MFIKHVRHQTRFEALCVRQRTKHSSCPNAQSGKCQTISAVAQLRVRDGARGRVGKVLGYPAASLRRELLKRELSERQTRGTWGPDVSGRAEVCPGLSWVWQEPGDNEWGQDMKSQGQQGPGHKGPHKLP